MMKKAKSDIVESTLRLPRAISVRIKHAAELQNLSMQQAIQQAILDYCRKLESERKGEK